MRRRRSGRWRGDGAAAVSAALLLAGAVTAACTAPQDSAPRPGSPEGHVETLGRTLRGGYADRTRGDLRAIAAALASRMADAGGYPVVADIDSLAAILEPRYLRRMPRQDAWGRPLRYRSDGDGFTLSSDGADGARGTPDDLTIGEGGLR